MAGDDYLASRRLAGGVARKSETPMGVLGLSIQQRLVDCMGVARRGVCADCASGRAGRFEYSWSDEKQTRGPCDVGSGIAKNRIANANSAYTFVNSASTPKDYAHNGKGNGNGNGNKGGSSKGGTADSRDTSVTLRHAGITISVARGYADEYGLSGYSALPPGVRKNLARGKPLPPGIAKKMVPGPMLARLPVYPGYEWRVAGSDLILVAVATAVVADVLFDVFD